MIRKPPSASKFVQRSEISKEHQSSATILDDTGDPDSAAAGIAENDLASIKNSRTYQVVDENAPGGKIDVDRDDLARGYEYGRTAVHISESDENVTKLETQAGLEIVGFIPWSSVRMINLGIWWFHLSNRSQYDRYMSMSVSSVIIAQKINNKAIMALSSLIWALSELESYAVARLVPKDGKPPVLIIVAPSIESDYECLLDVQLPFAEDVRSYKFPPLDRVITVSGKAITAHRNLPTKELSSAISDYVDAMDLSTFGKDDEGYLLLISYPLYPLILFSNPAEYMPMNETYSPILHRIDQAVRWRAIHPDEPIPPPYEILTRYSQPPNALVTRAKSHLERSIAAADVKKGTTISKTQLPFPSSNLLQSSS
jgi:ATP-dependent DNA helicase 2 subunit 2